MSPDRRVSPRWDTPSYHSFARTLELLDGYDYASVYHERSGEAHGSEATASLLWQRKINQSYVVDHAFIPRVWLGRVSRHEYGAPADWLPWSDHVPMLLEIDTPD